MPNSAISICNVALAALGCDMINSFEEESKQARLCNVLYPYHRDALISEHAWTCGRKVVGLSVVADSEISGEDELGSIVYTLPSDCLLPLDVLPLGSKDAWTVIGQRIATEVSEAKLLYTYSLVNPELFSHPFQLALVARMTAAIAPSMVQDKTLSEKLVNEAEARVAIAKATDANAGSEYRLHDEDPENDTFVNP